MGTVRLHLICIVLLCWTVPVSAQVMESRYDWRSALFVEPSFVRYTTLALRSYDGFGSGLYYEFEESGWVHLFRIETDTEEFVVFPFAPTFLSTSNLGTAEVYGRPSFAGMIMSYNDYRYAAVDFVDRDGNLLLSADGSTYITDAIYLLRIENVGRALVLWFPAGAIVGASVAFLFNWLLLIPSIVR